MASNTAGARTRRVLVVNAYFDDLRRSGGRPFSAPQAIGPIYLAGAFCPRHCDVRLYNEQYSGALEDPALLGWPDVLVLTGLTVAVDRMRQIAAYARSLNPAVIVIAGGPGVRALPRYCRQFFDYACTGDVEQVSDVILEALGPQYVAREMFPRFDLCNWFGRIAYLEASRNCNFRCSFCSLTGEGNRYQAYPVEDVRRQIEALGRRGMITFLDNNFYGSDRHAFSARVDMLAELWREKRFGGWTALVSNDFFLDQKNVERVRDAGCYGMFSGVESFDSATLRRYRKLQNTPVPQVDLIRGCLESGLMFAYGLIFDLTTRSIEDCHEELQFVTGTPEIPLPAFVTQTIPLLGTPYFHETVKQAQLLPMTRLRDMDGSTLVQRPLDPMDKVVEFLRGLPTLAGYRARVMRHSAGFLRRYARRLGPVQLAIPMASAAMLTAPSLASNPLRLLRRRGMQADRTHVAGSEHLDQSFTPAFKVAARYESWFQPTLVTDHEGCISEELAADLLPQEAKVPLRFATEAVD